jgi:LAS superfamily LD-carboxypeptidase LdcB
MIRVQPLNRPSDLADAKNGHILGEFLEPAYPGGDVLHHVAARAYQAMYAKARGHDIDLVITDGYRPYVTQERLFRERYLDHYNPLKTTTKRKSWLGRWWYKRLGVATAATPGTSNHGWGLAVDVHSSGLGSISKPGPKLRWLDEYAEDYGFSWELIPEEPWHLRYWRGDDIPAPVLAYEALLGRNPAADLPVFEEDDMYFVKVPTLAGFDIYHLYRHEATGFLVRRPVSGTEWTALRHKYEAQLVSVPWEDIAALAEAPGI